MCSSDLYTKSNHTIIKSYKQSYKANSQSLRDEMVSLKDILRNELVKTKNELKEKLSNLIGKMNTDNDINDDNLNRLLEAQRLLEKELKCEIIIEDYVEKTPFKKEIKQRVKLIKKSKK